MTIDPGDHHRTTTTEVLLRCGMLAGPLFIVTFLIEGLARPDYNPLRHPVSSLALGPNGWIQMANFMVAGVLYLALATGVLLARREQTVGPRSGAILIGAVGVGLLGSGAFITDPVSGYPPGTPDLLTSYTTSGALHDAFSVPVFLGLPAAAVTYAWWFLRHGNARLGAGLPRRLRSDQHSLQPGSPTRGLRRTPSAHHDHHRVHLAHPAGDPRPPSRDVASDRSGRHVDLTATQPRPPKSLDSIAVSRPACGRRPGSRTHRKHHTR